jgi:dipeptidase E
MPGWISRAFTGRPTRCGRSRRPKPCTSAAANSFRLLDKLYEVGLLDVIRRRVNEGLPFMGVSAGSNMACPTLMTTNDMPIVQPPSFKALGLVSFQINPHYFSGRTWVHAGEELQEHFGETRDDRIAEFHEMNDLPVIGLREGGILRIEGEDHCLLGAPARLFVKGREPVDIDPGGHIWPP